MDLVDGMTAEEMAEAAALETRRVELVRGVEELEKAKQAYDADMDKVRGAVKREEARAKAAAKKIATLKRESTSSHHWLEHCHDCQRALMAEYVDHNLIATRDAALAVLNKKSRTLRKAQGELDELNRVLGQRDPKTILGVLRNAQGEALREDPSPDNPSAVPPRKTGQIRNPNLWHSKEERKAFMPRVEDAERAVAEAEIAADKVAKVYADAEAAVSQAYEVALRGQ